MPRDDAVSPLIAVMSLALTAMALAAVVFLVARSLDDNGSGYVPPVAIVENGPAGMASVPLGQPEADWSRIELTSSKPVRLALNGVPDSSSIALPAHVAVAASAEPRAVRGGDFLRFCGDGGLQTDVHVRLTYREAGGGQVLKDLEYALLAPCP